jgi:PAS domain S-box-containing protein
MVGWSEAELLNKAMPHVYWAPEEETDIRDVFARVLKGKPNPGGYELKFRRRDKSRFHALVLFAPLLNSGGKQEGWLASITDITQRKNAEEALRRAHAELETRVKERTADLASAYDELNRSMVERKQLEERLLVITEQQRYRKTVEGHDYVGQKLAGMALMIRALRMKLERQKLLEAADAEKIDTLIQDLMQDSQDPSRRLTEQEPIGGNLLEQIESLVRVVRTAHAVECRLTAGPDLPEFEQSVRSHLYRISQEAVANAIKHGQAKKIGIKLQRQNQMFVMQIKSNGLPFPDMDVQNSGVGLLILQYRANLISGNLQVKANGRHGAVVTCSVAVPQWSG